jgi:hypothetical protein
MGMPGQVIVFVTHPDSHLSYQHSQPSLNCDDSRLYGIIFGFNNPHTQNKKQKLVKTIQND